MACIRWLSFLRLRAAEALDFCPMLWELLQELFFGIPLEEFEVLEVKSRCHGTSDQGVATFWIHVWMDDVVVHAKPRSWIS